MWQYIMPYVTLPQPTANIFLVWYMEMRIEFNSIYVILITKYIFVK